MLAAIVGAALVAVEAARGWRLVALPPIWLGALALIEANARTCVMLAARGVRNMDAGDERVADAAERRALMRRAWSVHLWTLLLTVLLVSILLSL